jgi:hypothetical protein
MLDLINTPPKKKEKEKGLELKKLTLALKKKKITSKIRTKNH